MSDKGYEVRVHEIDESDDKFSVKATVNGETIAHGFPKDNKWEEKDEKGVPRFVYKLVERRKRIEEKLRSQGVDLEDYEETTFEV